MKRYYTQKGPLSERDCLAQVVSVDTSSVEYLHVTRLMEGYCLHIPPLLKNGLGSSNCLSEESNEELLQSYLIELDWTTST